MHLLVLLTSVAIAYSGVALVKRADSDPGYSGGPQCYDKKDRQCYKVPKQLSKQACHEEYDVIEDTVYYEECEDIIETYCEDGYKEEQSKIAHTNSAVLGHDSKLVGHGTDDRDGSGYGKREAEVYGYSGHTEHRCHDNKETKCKNVPLTNKRKVPKPICKEEVTSTYIEECKDIITSHCEEYHKHVEHTSNVVEHDHDSYDHGYQDDVVINVFDIGTGYHHDNHVHSDGYHGSPVLPGGFHDSSVYTDDFSDDVFSDGYCSICQ